MAEYIDMGDKYSIEDILEAGRKLCKDPTSLTEAKRNWFMEGFKVGYFQCLGDYVLNKNKDGVPKKYAPDEFFNHKRQKNIERIWNMSDDELAEFLNRVETDGRCGFLRGKHGWLDWLQQEVDDGESN